MESDKSLDCEVWLACIFACEFCMSRFLEYNGHTPSGKIYAQIVKMLKAYFSPKPVVIVEHYHFQKCNQHKGESIAQYVAVLKLAKFCQFGSYLQDALMDRSA